VGAENELIVVLCTVPDEATAQRLANGLVEERLAACVNSVFGVKSFYRWEGKIAVDSELQLVIKTRRGRFDELTAWIKANHPYEVPEIVAIPVERVSDDYLAWAVEQTSPK
jgi:periplasmic divalent cation tolerance protein